MTRRLPELLTGLAVIVIAVVFLIYALGQANAISAAGYPLKAQFSSIGGLTPGSDVKIGGVVVGHVADEHLDPTTYAAVVDLSIDDDIKIPQDSSAAISSDGLLGGDYVAVSPGGSATMLASGQSFPVTQSAINIEDLLGKFIFSMGGSSGTKPSGTAGSSAAAPANPAALPTSPTAAPAK
jgi:phospholipid/cholesterol/gamma-HCH transport system substrate-binding protein